MAITAISRDWGVDPSIVRLTTTDDLATITTNGYLEAQDANIILLQNGEFQWVDGDYILIVYSGGEGFFTRDATNATFVAAATVPGTLSNTLPSGDIFVGSAGNVATARAVTGDISVSNTGVVTIQNLAVTGAKMANNTVTSTQLALNTIQYAKVTMSAADFNGAYAAPVQIVAAPGANLMIVVAEAALVVDFGAAQFAAGGTAALQYNSTAHAAGVTLASDSIANTVAQGWAADSTLRLAGAMANGVSTATVNQGLYWSNDTAAFTTGDSTVDVHVWYAVVATTL